MAIIVETETCTGCRSCELACSFHHHKIFARKMGSIEVKRVEKDGTFTIAFYPQPEDKHLACDCPKGKEFCVPYCPVVARGELKAILWKRKYKNLY
jgi:Fe-S-cluster-containing dehydrogenase component